MAKNQLLSERKMDTHLLRIKTTNADALFKAKFLVFAVMVTVVSLISSYRAYAITYDMASTSSWNIRIDGASAGDYLTHYSLKTTDFDDDGKEDLVIGALNADNNNRSNSGSLYLIKNETISALSGSGNILDLSNSSNYYLRIDGATAGDQFSDGVEIQDFNNDGELDFFVTSGYSDFTNGNNSAALYIIYHDKLTSFTGTGNTMDMADTNNFTVRFDGSTTSSQFSIGTNVMLDIDNNGKKDLILSEPRTDYNSRTDAGSVYIVLDSILDEYYTGTGQLVNMLQTTSYSLRIDGAGAGDYFGQSSIAYGHMNNDNYIDLLLGMFNYDYNGRNNSGGICVISGATLQNISGTGNTRDLATISNCAVILVGATETATLGSSTSYVSEEFNGEEFVLTTAITGGSLYIINKNIIKANFGAGDILDMASSSSYSLRIDADNVADLFSYFPIAKDINNDGSMDIVSTARVTDYNSRSNSGSFYVFLNSVLGDLTTTGRIIDVSNSDAYSIRYDGAGANDWLSYLKSRELADMNGDGSLDILIGANTADNNSRVDSGSLYIIYNFPHEISITTEITSPTTVESHTLTGSIDASDSLTTITNLQWGFSNDPQDTWSACTATDGTFDEKTENFTCELSGYSQGDQTVYLRALDSNGFYTAPSNYGTIAFTYDTNGPTGIEFEINKDGKSSEDPTPRYLSKRKVRLYFDAHDFASQVTHMRIAEDKNKLKEKDWRTYDDSITWEFSKDGLKKLYAQFKDSVNNETAIFTQTITIDTVPPHVTLTDLGTLNSQYGLLNSVGRLFKVYYYTESNLALSGKTKDLKFGDKIVIRINGNELYGNSERIKDIRIDYETGIWSTKSIAFLKKENSVQIYTRDRAGNESDKIEFILVIDPSASETNEATTDIANPIKTAEK